MRPSVKLVMAASEDFLQLTHVFLARIRCLQECIRCFKEGLPLPEAICYVRDECPMKAAKHGKVTLHASPEPSKQTESEKVVELLVGPEDIVYVSGEEYCNNQGQWAAVRRVRMLHFSLLVIRMLFCAGWRVEWKLGRVPTWKLHRH